MPASALEPSRPASQLRPSNLPPTDLRDDSEADEDDGDYHDGFEAAHAAYLARRIAEARAESAASAAVASHYAAQPSGGMSPFDESAIDHEWEELVKSMKAIVPTVAHFIGSSLGPVVFAMVCTWLGFKFHKVVLDRV